MLLNYHNICELMKNTLPASETPWGPDSTDSGGQSWIPPTLFSVPHGALKSNLEP